MSKIGYIYALVHPKTRIVRYIGKSINPTKRLYNHIKEQKNSDKNKWIKKLLNKGLKPYLVILCICDLKNINRFEKQFITKYRKSHNLLNNRSGGDGWSLTKKPDNREHLLGLSYKRRRKVIIRNIKTGEEQLFNSITECANFLNKNRSVIGQVIKNSLNYKSCRGYYIRYAETSFIEPVYKSKNIKISATNLETGKKLYFNSVREATRFGFDKRAIKSILNKTRKEFKGYTFNYVK